MTIVFFIMVAAQMVVAGVMELMGCEPGAVHEQPDAAKPNGNDELPQPTPRCSSRTKDSATKYPNAGLSERCSMELPLKKVHWPQEFAWRLTLLVLSSVDSSCPHIS